jgi:hypothetical protein
MSLLITGFQEQINNKLGVGGKKKKKIRQNIGERAVHGANLLYCRSFVCYHLGRWGFSQ